MEEIRENSHYDEATNHSRTMYQLDQEIAFIEAKFVELFTAAESAGIL